MKDLVDRRPVLKAFQERTKANLLALGKQYLKNAEAQMKEAIRLSNQY